jgi:hypothetical protein
MRNQIEQLVDGFESLNKEEQGKVKKIIKEYVFGITEIKEAYDKLVKEGFIQKSSSRFRDEEFTTKKDEEELKKYIMNKIPKISNKEFTTKKDEEESEKYIPSKIPNITK